MRVEKADITMEELGDALCDFCPSEVKGATGGPNGPIMCEGCWCEEAYEAYLEGAP